MKKMYSILCSFVVMFLGVLVPQAFAGDMNKPNVCLVSPNNSNLYFVHIHTMDSKKHASFKNLLVSKRCGATFDISVEGKTQKVFLKIYKNKEQKKLFVVMALLPFTVEMSNMSSNMSNNPFVTQFPLVKGSASFLMLPSDGNSSPSLAGEITAIHVPARTYGANYLDINWNTLMKNLPNKN